MKQLYVNHKHWLNLGCVWHDANTHCFTLHGATPQIMLVRQVIYHSRAKQRYNGYNIWYQKHRLHKDHQWRSMPDFDTNLFLFGFLLVGLSLKYFDYLFDFLLNKIFCYNWFFFFDFMIFYCLACDESSQSSNYVPCASEPVKFAFNLKNNHCFILFAMEWYIFFRGGVNNWKIFTIKLIPTVSPWLAIIYGWYSL